MLVRLTTILLLAAPAATWAHDLWIEPGPGGFVLRHGHRGGELLEIDAAKVKAIRCAARDGAEPPRDVRPEAAFEGREVTVRARCFAVSAFLDAGYFAVVTIDHRPLGETDHAGEIRVKVRAREIECVSASLRRPLRSAQADADVLEASLAFEVGR